MIFLDIFKGFLREKLAVFSVPVILSALVNIFFFDQNIKIPKKEW